MLVGLFEKIWSMSVVGCYIILVVMLVRFLLHKCERKYSYLLWFVVFLNLCLPITIQGSFSLLPRAMFTWTQVKQEEVQEAFYEDMHVNTEATMKEQLTEGISSNTQDIYYIPFPMEGIGISEGKQEVQQREPSGERKTAEIFSGQSDALKEVVNTAVSEIQQPKLFWQQRVCYLWLVVVLLLWGISIIKCVKLNRSLRECRDTGFWMEQGIVVAKDLETPFLWGVRRPIIYLPETMEEIERNYIIAHESHHRKRLDHISKLIVFVVVTLHWFNPLVWAAYALFVRDMEISCDEAVLRHSKQDIKKQYASSLLKYAARQNGFVFTPLTFGEPSLKSRIRNVLGYRKQGLLLTIVSVMVVCFTACGLLTRPMEKAEAEKHTVSSETSEEGYGESMTSSKETEKAENTIVLPQYQHYPQYFYEMLCAREAGETSPLQSDEGLQHNYSLPSDVREYQDDVPAYSANGNIWLEEGAVLQIDWLKLSNDRVLENLTFDMKTAYEQEQVSGGYLTDIFYVSERDKVYLLLTAFNMTDNNEEFKEVTWLLEFSPEAPQEYQMECYDTNGAWFGECRMLGDSIFLHAGAGTTPYEINLLTKDGRSCEREYHIAKQTIQSFAKDYAKEHEKEVGVQWFSAVGQYGDVTIFSGIVAEDMDFPEVATIYLARQNGKIIQAMLVEAENGEVILLQTVPKADISNATLIQQPVGQEAEWVKTILSICEENDGNARDFGWENSVLPVFADMTGEEEAVYGDNGELCADNEYTLECWMNLPDGTALKELQFDLQQEMENHAWTKAFVSGVFYHRGQVFIVLPAGGTAEGVMIINFSPNAPQNYQIHSYEGISAWFGEIVMIGEDICVHGANGSYPWRINVEGWEIISTAKEFAETQKRVEAYRKALKKEEAELLSLQWFYASGRIEDVEIYTGYLGEDVGSERAIIYVAFQERECVGCILMGTETGEIEYLSVKPGASTIHSEK